MSFQTPITVAKAIERIAHREYVLPAIQRELVWSTDQITRLFDSLMRGYPIGSFLFWKVDKTNCRKYVFYDFVLNYDQRSPHPPKVNLDHDESIIAVLDGQQRLSALNIGIAGTHIEKLPNKWRLNPLAYPTRRLYLNLTERAPENDLGTEFDFRFLTEERARALTTTTNAHFFLVRDSMSMDGARAIFRYIQQCGLAEDESAFNTLDRLREVIREKPIINYYEEESQDLDKVLNIFIRINSGGTQLSYSDLLLSIATAQWQSRDARIEINQLLDDLNKTGQGFAFNKDLILKAGLVLADIPNIRFTVTNFNRDNMAILEKSWDDVATALRLAARLLSDFGFSERTLTADSVLIPLAYYARFRGLDTSYLNATSMNGDRAMTRAWVVRSLLKTGVWGSSLDTLLAGLREVIKTQGTRQFPAPQLETEMARQGKTLRFEEDEVRDLLDSEYKERITMPLLSLLYPGMDFRNEFHVDHVFPSSLFRTRSLRKAGLNDGQIARAKGLANQLANLQLLEGPINLGKSDKLPLIWIREKFKNTESGQGTYLERHLLDGLTEDLVGFFDFFEGRQKRIEARIREILDPSVPPTFARDTTG